MAARVLSRFPLIVVRVVTRSKSSLALSHLPEVTWRQRSTTVAINLSCLLQAHQRKEAG